MKNFNSTRLTPISAPGFRFDCLSTWKHSLGGFSTYLVAIMLLALPLSLYAQKPAASLEQVRNGGATSPVSPGNWQNGNLNASQAHFVESHSIPYRALLTGLPSNTQVRLTMAYDIRHSSRNALDFLTHFDRIQPHGQFFHDQEIIDPTIGTSFTGQLNSPTSTKEIPRPTLLRADGVPGIAWDQLSGEKREMTMWGGEILSIEYDGSGDLSVSNSEQRIIVTFRTGITGSAVLAWGGHIASRLDWGYDNAGVPLSAGGISGSPYHMRLKNWTLGNLGNQDRSLAAAAVIAPPGCTLTGATAACTSVTNNYSTTETADSYAWTFAANTSGAFFTNSNGDNLGTSITTTTGSILVNSGPNGGSYTVNLVTTRNGISSTDLCQVTASITADPTADAGNAPAAQCFLAAGNTFLLDGDGTNGTASWAVAPDGNPNSLGVVITNGSTFDPSVKVTGSGSVTLRLTVTSSATPSCGSTTSDVTVTVNPEPLPPSVTYNAPACDEATFSVTVNSPVIGATYSILDKNGASISGVTPSASIIPTVESPTVEFSNIPAGSGYQVTVTSTDGCASGTTSCSSASLTSQKESSPTSNERENKEEEEVLSLKKDKMVAYPVPFSNKLNLEFYTEEEGNFQVNLYDMSGKLVKQLKSGISQAGELQHVEVDGLGLHDGMYLVSVMSGKEKQTIRIIKKE